MKTYKRILDAVCFLFEVIAAVFLCAMVFIIAYHVIMRYYFNLAPRWSEELSLQLMIWFCFIATLLGVKQQAHIAIELFVKKLPKKLFFAVTLLDRVLVGVFGVLTCVSIVPYITRLSRNKLPATGWPVWVQFAAPCVAGALIALIIVEQVIVQLTGEASMDEKDEKKELVNL
ncbi:MAG: TRAP transporter small permease [Synergistaceae bacterium]|nr:TRAP transporter small permease [Synergistaceae bacterium]